MTAKRASKIKVIAEFLDGVGIAHQDIKYDKAFFPLDNFSFKCRPVLAEYVLDECFVKIFGALGFSGCMTISGSMDGELVTMRIDKHNFQRENYEFSKNICAIFNPPDGYEHEEKP